MSSEIVPLLYNGERIGDVHLTPHSDGFRAEYKIWPEFSDVETFWRENLAMAYTSASIAPDRYEVLDVSLGFLKLDREYKSND